MQSIEISELEKFNSDLDELLKQVPGARCELHEKIGQMAGGEVENEIAQSGFKGGGEKLRNWQEVHIGSRGGYAAVRPTNAKTGDNSPGAITNYNEGGHTIRNPTGKSKNYRSKIKVPYVEGRHFYQSARRTAEKEAIEIAEDFADKLAEKLEG